ncbi:MAG: hypothetical protein ACLSE4_05295 [Clostridium sp.]
MNEEDICIGTESNLLINSTELSFDELWDIVTGQYGGVMIPAHIDKNANSLISNLGFVPPESQFRTAELHDMAALEKLKEQSLSGAVPHHLRFRRLHYLEHIHEPEWKMKVREKSAAAVIRYLRENKICQGHSADLRVPLLSSLRNALISIKIEFRNHGQAFSELKMPYDAVVAADFADFRKGERIL